MSSMDCENGRVGLAAPVLSEGDCIFLIFTIFLSCGLQFSWLVKPRLESVKIWCELRCGNPEKESHQEVERKVIIQNRITAVMPWATESGCSDILMSVIWCSFL